MPTVTTDEKSLYGNILGIDEAGRGPLIGPMVVCGFCADGPAQLAALGELGLKDSKKLSPKKREEIYQELQSFHFSTMLISPAEIDKGNITELELQAAGMIYSQFSPHVIIMDAPCNPAGIPNLNARLQAIIKKQKGNMTPRLILENKADGKYLTCMAASIVAKVTRDREIAALHEIFGDFGSGYPSDPKTRQFVASMNGGLKEQFSHHIRQKWSTLGKLDGYTHIQG